MNNLTKKQLNKKELERLEKRRAYNRLWSRNNPDKRRAGVRKWIKNHPEKNRANAKKWRDNNPDKARATHSNYYLKNRNKVLASVSKYRKNNLEKVNLARHKYTMSNVNFRLANNLRARLRIALVIQLTPKKGHLKDLIGTTIPQLKVHLEKQFQPDMTWDNYGYYGWHIDHRVPISFFDLTKLSEQKKAMHYTNLQPLWAKDNLSKGARIML